MYQIIPQLDVVFQKKLAPWPPKDVTKPALLWGQWQSAQWVEARARIFFLPCYTLWCCFSRLCYHYHHKDKEDITRQEMLYRMRNPAEVSKRCIPEKHDSY